MSTGTNFPTSLDSFTDKVDDIDDILAVETNTQSSAIEALQSKVGITDSADTNSFDYKINVEIDGRLDDLETETKPSAKGDLLTHDGSDLANLPVGLVDGHVLMVDSNEDTGIKWAVNPSGFPDPMTTRGDIIVRNASNLTDRLAIGSANALLKSDGADVTWEVPTQTFDTNFSIDQKEDTEDSEYDNQQHFQTISYGCKFTSVTDSALKLQTCDVIYVPADSHEVTYGNSGGGSGSWSNNDSSSFLYGRAKYSSTLNDTAVVPFTGTGFGFAIYSSTDKGYVSAELSDDDGVTWKNKILITSDSGGSDYYMNYELYTGLSMGNYKVKITVQYPASNIGLMYFFYQAKMVQYPATQYYYQATAVKTLSDVPPGTMLLTGTWTNRLSSDPNSWNYLYHSSQTQNDTIEFKFFGKQIWVALNAQSAYNPTIGVLIDGVTTNVKSSSFTQPQGTSFSNTYWVRLDNGGLTDGVHTVKLTRSNASTGNYIVLNGFASYSDLNTSTLCNSLIVGNQSFAVGVDKVSADPAITGDLTYFTYSIGGWGAISDGNDHYLRRYKYTNTNTDYCTITTPNNANLKAIYLVYQLNTDKGDYLINLGGASTNSRYLTGTTATTSHLDPIACVYDATIDGITLHNKELRITKVSGTNMPISAVIFEIHDTTKCGLTSIKVHPKWTRNNLSTNLKTPVSNTYYLSITGAGKTGEGRKPVIHSGWEYIADNGTGYCRNGIFSSKIGAINCYLNSGPQPQLNNATIMSALNGDNYGFTADSIQGVSRKTAGASPSARWRRFVIELSEVI